MRCAECGSMHCPHGMPWGHTCVDRAEHAWRMSKRPIPTTPPVTHDPIQQAVDDYLLMERKARAWDALREGAEKMGALGLLAQMDVLVHPAQPSAPAER